MQPLGDQIKVELQTDTYNFGGAQKKGFESGIAVELPDRLNYFGYHSFAYESSLANRDVLDELYDYYKGLIGKRVYWTEMGERGLVYTLDDKTFAMIKLTDLVGFSNADVEALSLSGNNGGTFNV